MKLLVVSATEGEVSILKKHMEDTGNTQHDVKLLVTGVGQVATTYALTRELTANKYDFVIQAGVGGSFDKNIPLGEVLLVTSERYGDLGAEDHDNYIDIFEMGLIDGNAPPYTAELLTMPDSVYHKHIMLPQVSGLTINTVSGNEHTIARRAERYGCTVESMEGAAFHYVCINEGAAFAQVRAVSNYVQSRDKSQWRMKDAIVNLNKWLIGFIDSCNSPSV